MFKNIDILFLGSLYPKKNEQQIRSKVFSDMQDAANVFQWNIINGLITNGIQNMQIVSLLPIDSWPKHYKDPFIKYFKEETDFYTFETVGFCNITYLKHIVGRKACNQSVIRWAKRKKNSKKVIICYSSNNVLMRSVKAAKKINPNIIAIEVIADITEFATNSNMNLLQKFYRDHQIKVNKELFKVIDGFVLLTEQMSRKLHINKPYIVMEGIVPDGERVTRNDEITDIKTVLYTGSMNSKYGILELLNAFTEINNSNYELVLCGLGNSESEIRKFCKKDSRIKFLGKVSHSEVLKLQQKATVLVNPRQNNEEFTKYSFPSKTMEYLASGVPLVAYKLDGIPEEYDEYINYVSDNKIESLANTICEVCERTLEQRKWDGERAREFVVEEKNALRQTRKILKLIQRVEEQYSLKQ